MTELPPEQPGLPIDPRIITRGPISPEAQDFDGAESDFFIQLVGELSSQVEELTAENNRLTAQQDFEAVKASMAKPYADKVFWFLVWYCVVVAFIVIVNGFGAGLGFHLSDTVMGIIAGSTAVSAIGLVGFVVNGLFGRSKHG